MERSSSTFPQTHIFFVPSIKGLAQTILMWEGKGFAAVDADAAETDWKHKVTPERGGLINRVNQWLSNWRTLCNCVLPACRWPSTYSTSGCMIWYDEGVSVVWIDTYPSRFFTLHIHFFSLNNAGNYNEFHICNGIWSKKTTINVVYYWHKFTQHKYYFWKHLLTVALIALSNKIFIICVPHFFLVKQPLLFVNTEALPHGTCSNLSPAAVNMAA